MPELEAVTQYRVELVLDHRGYHSEQDQHVVELRLLEEDQHVVELKVAEVVAGKCSLVFQM